MKKPECMVEVLSLTTLKNLFVDLRELCWNNFGNFEATQYSRIILRIIEHKRNNEEHNASNSCHKMVEDRTNQGTELGTNSE